MAKVYVALGANLCLPKQQLDDASEALAALALADSYQISPYYQSIPMGEVEQPDYVNAVASFDTELSPIELLDALQQIEQQQGRVRDIRWGPRTLDLDILLYDQLEIQIPRLTIPHYGMKNRSFVLVPLLDLAPDLILPCGTRVASLVNSEMNAELSPLDPDPCSQS